MFMQLYTACVRACVRACVCVYVYNYIDVYFIKSKGLQMRRSEFKFNYQTLQLCGVTELSYVSVSVN